MLLVGLAGSSSIWEGGEDRKTAIVTTITTSHPDEMEIYLRLLVVMDG